MIKSKNLLKIGDIVGNVRIIGRAPDYVSRSGERKICLRCECLCVNKTRFNVRQDSLRNGRTKSCGCLAREVIIKNNTSHGMARHPLYHMCFDAINRCYNENSQDYKNYGARGIKVHKPWRDDIAKFIKWIEKHLGLRPSKNHSLDRKDNDGNYEPGNLRWATYTEQSGNQRSNKIFRYKDIQTGKYKTQHLSAWCREYNKQFNLVNNRINRGISISDALTTPSGGFVRKLKYKGKELTIPEWSIKLNIPAVTIRTRLRNGWSVEETLTTKVKHGY